MNFDQIHQLLPDPPIFPTHLMICNLFFLVKNQSIPIFAAHILMLDIPGAKSFKKTYFPAFLEDISQ